MQGGCRCESISHRLKSASTITKHFGG